jgi:ATP-dependent RNA helicase DHX29
MAARVQISAETEARVRSVLGSLPAQQAEQTRPSQRNLRKRVLDVYASVAAQGFPDAAVQAALRAVVLGGADVSTSSVFDWLCINLPEALPSKFSAGERHGSKRGTVTVLAAARADADSGASRPLAEADSGQVVELSQRSSARGSEPSASADREREKEWIRRYMERESSDEEELAGEDVTPHTDAAGQEQLETARMQAHLAALTDTWENRQSLAQELDKAREDAKHAKAQLDAAGQQRAGAVIRAIKEQLQRLGITEEECLGALCATADAEPADDEDGAAAGSALRMRVATDVTEADEEAFASLFDESAAVSEPCVPRAPALCTILSRAARQPAGAGAKRGKPAARAAAEAQQLPKGVLQQHCARQQWPAPRFERVAAGPSGLCYSVTLTCSLPARRGKRQMHTVTVELPGGRASSWSSVEEAQNAVATRALYQLLPDQALHHVLPAPYSCLWREWEEAAARSGVDEVLDRDALVASFVDNLLAELDAGVVGAAHGERLRSGDTAGSSVAVSQLAQMGAAPNTAQPQPATAATLRSAAAQLAHLRAQLLAREQSPAYADIAAQRSSLPIAAVRSDIAAALHASDALVVCGETGCGKTTQVPQFLLDDAIASGDGAACSIIITQPRRVAVMSVADRVAFERLEAAPGAPGASVGYQVRLDAARSAATRLLFCTAGILLRRLHSDPLLEGTSHVVVDEVHERSLQTDLLLTILRDLPARRLAAGRPGLKLVLMSATLDATFFSHYLGGCSVVSALGRSFAVAQHYLEDVYELCAYLLPLDSPAALRPPKNAAHLPFAKGDRRSAKIVEDGWVRVMCVAGCALGAKHVRCSHVHLSLLRATKTLPAMARTTP